MAFRGSTADVHHTLPSTAISRPCSSCKLEQSRASVHATHLQVIEEQRKVKNFCKLSGNCLQKRPLPLMPACCHSNHECMQVVAILYQASTTGTLLPQSHTVLISGAMIPYKVKQKCPVCEAGLGHTKL